MDSAILYLFSTIAQVLAAILAFVFVFILFKLQYLDKKLDVICIDFAQKLGSNVSPPIANWQDIGSGPEFMKNYKSKFFQGITGIMFKICNEREAENETAVKKLRIIAEKAEIVETERKNIIINVKKLTALGFVTIIYSIVMIPFAKYIESNWNLKIGLISTLLILTSLTLIWVYKILVKALGAS